MALLKCPECNGIASDKAISCPHCGFPLKKQPDQQKRKRTSSLKRRRNGTGTVVKLSGNRRKPFEVRVNCKIDERGYPDYDVLNRYSDKLDADLALANYNKNPYNVKASNLTFKDVYDLWFEQKFVNSKKKYSKSLKNCSKGAFKKCITLHNRLFKDITSDDLQEIIDNDELSHAYIEHIKNLFNQLYKFARKYKYVTENEAQYITINKEDDDEHGVPFTPEEINLLWKKQNDPWVASIIIYIYSGFRVSELLEMPTNDINLIENTFFGGNKTENGKCRTVPIHHKIIPLVKKWKDKNNSTLFSVTSKNAYYPYFQNALKKAGIKPSIPKHTPHDCRHTFRTELDKKNANLFCVKLLMGHALGNDMTDSIYNHKTLEDLRKTIELID